MPEGRLCEDLMGGDGDDVLRDPAGEDDHFGGDGADHILDLAGNDELDGGDQNETLDALDRVALDILNGGFGGDTCFADATDTVVSCP